MQFFRFEKKVESKDLVVFGWSTHVFEKYAQGQIATWGDDDSDLPCLGRFVIQHFGIGDFTSGVWNGYSWGSKPAIPLYLAVLPGIDIII